MVGDFWGATEADAFWNKHGVSSVFAETEKGHVFLKSVPDITLFETSFDRAVQNNPMVIKSKIPHKRRDQFEKLLSEKGLIYAAKHCQGLTGILKNAVKKILPKKWIPFLKNLVKQFLA